MMLTSLLSLLSLPAMAGYGDPQRGYPNRDERWLHLWTNAARVAPDAFESEYREGGCSFEQDFSDDEQQPKDPLYLDYGLAEAARYHSEDMASNGCFQHESCDGTDTWDRIGRYYGEGGAMGENIAMGIVDAKYAVLSMWMCSTSGHRANIMSGDFNELGVGVAEGGGGNYFTQDFAAGVLSLGEPPVRIAADNGLDVFYADYAGDGAPASISVVVDGHATPMQHIYGTDSRGVWWAESGAVSGDCQSWWISYEDGDGNRWYFPEDGAYRIGNCGEDWIGSRPDGGDSGEDGNGGISDPGALATPSTLDDDIKLSGCQTAGGAGGPGLLLAGLLCGAAIRGRGRW